MKNLILLITFVLIFSCSTEDIPIEVSYGEFTKLYDNTLWIKHTNPDPDYPTYMKFSEDYIFQNLIDLELDPDYSSRCYIVEEGTFFDSVYGETGDGGFEYKIEIIENEGNKLSCKITDIAFPEYTAIWTFEYFSSLILMKMSVECFLNDVSAGLFAEPIYYEEVKADSFTLSSCSEVPNSYFGCI